MRRWTRRIAVCLVLGAVTTVAVAWGLVLKGPPSDDSPPSMLLAQDLWYRAFEPFALPEDALTISWRGITYAELWFWSDGPDGIAETFRGALRESAGGRDVLPPDEDSVEEVRGVLQAGWPIPALSGAIHTGTYEYVESSDPYKTNHEYVVTSSRLLHLRGKEKWLASGGQFDRTVLPLMPTPTGFAIDTVFYALVWLAAFTAFSAVRRSARRRRNHCTNCGYNLTGNTSGQCPECGDAYSVKDRPI